MVDQQKSVPAWEGGRASPYRMVEALERVLAVDRNWLIARPPELRAGTRDDVKGSGAEEQPAVEYEVLSVDDLLDVHATR